MALQEILVKRVGSDIVINKSNVVDFSENSDKVTVILGDGWKYEGDIFVGAHGNLSKVRTKLFGWQEAQYTKFTCYSGLGDYVPAYIDTIWYHVFMGLDRYFEASDVCDGKMQWYGFQKEPSGKHQSPQRQAPVLCKIYDIDMLLRLICHNHDIDVYDRDMLYTWSRRVALLGDAQACTSNAVMQPNLGQGCMAIEDSYRLILELEEVIKSIPGGRTSKGIGAAVKSFRGMKVGVTHSYGNGRHWTTVMHWQISIFSIWVKRKVYFFKHATSPFGLLTNCLFIFPTVWIGYKCCFCSILCFCW